MTISLETEIVGTRHDATARMSYYTIERDGRRWTVGVAEADWAKVPKTNQARRDYLGKTLTNAMAGPPDNYPTPGQPNAAIG